MYIFHEYLITIECPCFRNLNLIKESKAPEAPIKNIHISLIIGEEYILFDKIYDEQDSLKEKLSKINNIVIAALYFKIEHLPKKLCAISASLLLDSNIEEIKQMI